MHPVTKYALECVNGERIVGETERLACQRHLNDLEKAKDAAYPWKFDTKRAERVFKFFGYLHHVEGIFAGQNIELIDAHKFDLGCLFGWVHKETGLRRFKKAYYQVGRKNAKTTLLAGITNYMMVGDGEESPRVYCAAVDREQARLMYESSKAMATHSTELSRRLKIRDYQISHKTRGGSLKAMSKETRNKDGLNPSCAVIDEYHSHATSEIYDVISSAKGQRSQPLIVIITTAGMDVESPCYREYQYCKDILTGKISGDQASDRYFVMIRELDPGDDEHDPKNWIKANPLRCLIPESFAELQEQHDEAFSSADPAKVRTFRVKNLNIWVHGNEDSYMGEYMSKWDNLAVTPEEFWKLVKGKPCNVGVDLSKRVDLTADAFVFPLEDDRIALTARGFLPEEAMTRHEKTDHIPYREWSAAGWLKMTDGNVTDYKAIVEHVEGTAANNELSIQEICFDPYLGSMMANDFIEKGYTAVEIRQWMGVLSAATKLFRELVASGKIVHDGSPLLKWCVGNAQQITDTKENIMLTKKHAGDTRRIDLLAAVINALVRIQPLREAVNYGAWVKSEDFGM